MRNLLFLFSVLIGLLIFLSPSNLFYVLDESAGYVNGMRIDYLLPKIHLTDILLIITVAVGVLTVRTSLDFSQLYKKKYFLFLLFILAIAVSQLLSFNFLLGIMQLCRYLLLAILIVVLFKQKKCIDQKVIIFSTVAMLLFQLTLASIQFITQHSVFPSYLFLGESRLTPATIGLAHTTLAGEDRLLAYGTTAHPNILAGVTTLFSLVLLKYFYSKRKYFFAAAILTMVGLLLVITQSLAAFSSLMIGLLIVFKQPKPVRVPTAMAVAVVTCVAVAVALWFSQTTSDSLSISRRVLLNSAALTMFAHFPINGVGVGQFTAFIEQFMMNKELVRFLQPAHNLLLLWLAETGLLGVGGVLSAAYAFKKLRLPTLTLAMLPLITLDHYLYTIQSGMIGLALFIGLVAAVSQWSQEKH